MRTRLFLIITLLALGALALAACAPAEEMAPPQEEISQPKEVLSTPERDESYPAAATTIPAAPTESAYPATGEGGGSTEIYIPITGSEDAYPGTTDEATKNPGLVEMPYPLPGLENLDMTIKPENIINFEDTAPRPDDKSLAPGTAFIESVEAITQVDATPRANTLMSGPGLLIAGYLPTPCHQLRLDISAPDKSGNITINAYTVSDPDVMCIQVLQPFATFVPLADLPNGQYTITINAGEQPVKTVQVDLSQK